MILLSNFFFLLTLKKIIEFELPLNLHRSFFVLSAGVLAISYPLNWAIGAGQFTPLLFVGTWLSFYLQHKQKSILAGLLLATMAWIKYFPGALILFFLFKNDLKAFISFISGITFILFLGYVIFGKQVIMDYLSFVKAYGYGVSLVWINQAIEAFMMRFYFPFAITLKMLFVPLTPAVKIVSLLYKAILLGSWLVFNYNLKRHLQANKLTSVQSSPSPSAYYLMAVMILLLPVSWMHYFIFFIPLCIWILKLDLTHKGFFPLYQPVITVLALLFLFMSQNMLDFPGKILFPLLPRNIAEVLMKCLLNGHLFGGLLLLFLAQIKLLNILGQIGIKQRCN